MDGLEAVDDPIGRSVSGLGGPYRDEWDWDSVARSTHSVNCTGSCSWNVYVKNGQVWREEQSGDYPRFDESLPDPNPRGCQKGACYTDYVNAEQRIKHPLKRVGERGEGKWKRISWDEALTEIADHVIDEVQAGRYDAYRGFTPIPAMSPVSFASGSRLINLLGGVSHSFYDWYSDLPPGQPITWGTQTDNAESADWYNADYIIAWGSNINVTRIPDAKYFLESGYNGTKRVGIFTDYSQTAIHTDEWLSPDPGPTLHSHSGWHRQSSPRDCTTRHTSKSRPTCRFSSGKTPVSSSVRARSPRRGCRRPREGLRMIDADGSVRRAPGSLGERDGRTLLREHRTDSTRSYRSSGASIPTRAASRSGRSGRTSPTSSASIRRTLSTKRPASARTPTSESHVSSPRPTREDHPRQGRQRLVPQRPREPRNPVARHADRQPRRPGTGVDHYVGQEKIWSFHGWKALSFPTGNVRGVPTTLWTYFHAGILDNTDRGHRGEDTRVHRQGVDARLSRGTRRRIAAGPDDDVRLAGELLQSGQGERRRRRGVVAKTRPRGGHQLPDGLDGPLFGYRPADGESLREARPVDDGHAHLRASVHARC